MPYPQLFLLSIDVFDRLCVRPNDLYTHPFFQDADVALDRYALIQLAIHTTREAVDLRTKTLFQLIKTCIHLFETLIDLFEAAPNHLCQSLDTLGESVKFFIVVHTVYRITHYRATHPP